MEVWSGKFHVAQSGGFKGPLDIQPTQGTGRRAGQVRDIGDQVRGQGPVQLVQTQLGIRQRFPERGVPAPADIIGGNGGGYVIETHVIKGLAYDHGHPFDYSFHQQEVDRGIG